MDILNVMGIGEKIHLGAANEQREECEKRTSRNQFIPETTSACIPRVADGPILKSSGTVPQSVGNEALARVQRRFNAPG